MLTIPGYEITGLIHENSVTAFCRGRRIADGKPVIIKILTVQYPSDKDITLLHREFEITANLNIDGILKAITLEEHNNLPLLVFEDSGGMSLEEYQSNKTIGLPAFLDISLQLSNILGKIHLNMLVHRNIKPQCIILHPGTMKVYLTGFEKAGAAGSELLPNDAPHFACSPQYMSPEQTGRINKDVDHRSDLYSLGVTFYLLTTGRLPFQASDTMGWIHAHVAMMPIPPSEINNCIPKALSDIILKLLAKNPDHRYQSAYGLIKDLEKCRRQLERLGTIEIFQPGEFDIAGTLQIPRKLYGREKELEALSAAMKRVNAGAAELLLVSGYAGIGKTVLVYETFKNLVTEKGYFIAGKSDQLQKNVPYAPFIQAFGHLMRQIITESSECLAVWRRRLQRALGQSGAVITDVIPGVEMIVGPQPPVEALQPQEAQNRFRMVFRDFIRVFARKEHPLFIFLDDLQWADPASLQLIRHLGEDTESRYLLLIGAFRDNEITETHPLAAILEKFLRKEIPVRQIKLYPLDRSQTGRFITDALRCPEKKSYPLAEILYRKSGGNPFFLGQLLKLIYDEKLLLLNTKEGCWEWELESIQKMQMADDVVDLMIVKLQKLPAKTSNVLKLAACIGNIFDLNTLSVACEETKEETSDRLRLPVFEGLVQAIPGAAPEAAYEFSHDRVQQAAYSLIPEDEKKQLHLRIGRLILQNTDQNELDEKLFTIMDQLNHGPDLINDPADRLKLAGYNLITGRKAKDSAAYDSALKYFRTGMELLPEDSWDKHYQLTYDLYLERSQCEYFCGHIDVAESLFDVLLAQAGTNLEKARVYGLKMALASGMRKYEETVELGKRALRLLGHNLPSHPGKIDLAKEIFLAKWRLRKHKIEKLPDLPEISDPVQKKTLELLILMLPAANSVNLDLYALILLILSNLSMKYGNTVFSTYGYAGYSIVAGSVLGDYKTGHEMEKAVLQLVEKYDNSSAKCVIYFVLGSFVTHWTQHGKTDINYLRNSIRYGFESGQVLFMGYSLSVIFKTMYLLGIPLGEVAEEIQKCYNFAKRMKHENTFISAILFQRLVSVLRGLTADPFNFSAEGYDEDSLIKLMEGDNVSLLTYYFAKMQLCYLFGDYGNALAVADKAQKSIDAIMGFRLSAEHNFYYSLAITAAYNQLPPKMRGKYWKTLKKNQHQMKKWSDSCNENYLHKYLLVTAEMSRLRGRGQEAMFLYDQAIQSARKNGYTQIEALAGELAANFYLSLGLDKVAGTYMTGARYAYTRWGATAKATQLENDYAHLLSHNFEPTIIQREKEYEENSENLAAATMTGAGNYSGTLDIISIIKASQIISGEMVLEQLLEKMIGIVMENACAQRCFFILIKDNSFFIEAEGSVENGHRVLLSMPLDDAGGLSATIVRYVARTGEYVVMHDAENEGIFTGDIYVKNHRPKSILCVPVIYQGNPTGILYLENNLSTGVFTPDRVEVLKLLSSQAAISIENARLYAVLKESRDQISRWNQILEQIVNERTRDLKRINEQLEEEIAERRQVEEALRIIDNSRRHLLSNISHELKTPITSIQGFLETILDGVIDDPYQQDKYLRLVLNKVLSLNRLIQDLFDLTKLESRQITFNMKELNIGALVNCAQKMELDVKSAGIIFSVQADLYTPGNGGYDSGTYVQEHYTVNADPGRIEQVFANLVFNAIRHTPPGGNIYISFEVFMPPETQKDIKNINPEGYVHRFKMAESQTTQYVLIRVSDTGPGIKEEDMPYIFDRFYKGDKSRSRSENPAGSGLGLAISKEIVEYHGGRIWAENNPGKGCTFCFVLPLKPSSLDC